MTLPHHLPCVPQRRHSHRPVHRHDIVKDRGLCKPSDPARVRRYSNCILPAPHTCTTRRDSSASSQRQCLQVDDRHSHCLVKKRQEEHEEALLVEFGRRCKVGLPKISTLETVSGESHRLITFHIMVKEEGALMTARRPILLESKQRLATEATANHTFQGNSPAIPERNP